MKTKNNILKVYIEAVVYCILLVIGIYLCLSNNIYIKMLPIAFVIGVFGQVFFGKRLMTSFFSFMLAIVLSQVKTPASIVANLVQSAIIVISVLFGEAFGWEVKKIVHIFKKKKNKKGEKPKYIMLSVLTFTLAMIFSAIFNGNYFSYYNAKNKLRSYFKEEYSSSSRFQIVNCHYSFTPEIKYTFYTQDIMNNYTNGKFGVYLKNRLVQDEYRKQILDKTSQDLINDINNVIHEQDININAFYDDTDTLIISFSKSVEDIDKSQIEIYAKQVEECINNISNIKNFELIEQIQIMLNSTKNKKDNLASYIYMDGYKQMIEENKEKPYEYIMRALNIEYFN